MARQTAYITTPIYYVNDRPHIGHVYTTTVCDVWARFMRFLGRDVFFLTGTDEHGVKVEKSAQARGVSPRELADENAAEFQRALAMFNLTNDDFIRTTEARHERQVQAFVKRLIDTGAVYLGEFEGWYDEGQEEYVTENKAREWKYISPVSGRALVRAKETNYYFRLSAYQDKLEKLFAYHPEFVRPEARRNEVLGRLREGLQDVPISRTNFKWGISVPGDEKHVIYVWIDALMNYITALGLGESGGSGGEFGGESGGAGGRAKYWPATYHVIGKEILWFHAVIWPAMLMALGIEAPRCVYAHSFWISEGQKMSKSLGNFIDLNAIERYIGAYGLDAFRYYMATQGPLGATDADFVAAHFHDVYHTDLVNTVGNCASRVTAMIGKFFDFNITGETDSRGGVVEFPGFDWERECAEAVRKAIAAMERLDLAGSIAHALALIRRVDAFINATQPFKLIKNGEHLEQVSAIVYQSLEAVRIASLLLWPVMPAKMEELWRAISVELEPRQGGLEELTRWGGLEPGRCVRKVALFPRVEEPPVQMGAGAR